MPRVRGAAIIVKDTQILLLHRIKNGHEYYVFPGGGIDAGEDIIEGVIREIQEELSLQIKTIGKEIFRFTNQNGDPEYFYLVTDFEGEARLGGEEKERMSEENQYYVEWWELAEACNLDTLYPQEAKDAVCRYFGLS